MLSSNVAPNQESSEPSDNNNTTNNNAKSIVTYENLFQNNKEIYQANQTSKSSNKDIPAEQGVITLSHCDEQDDNGKCMIITPGDTCPDLFWSCNEVVIEESGLSNIPKDKRQKFTFFGIDPNPVQSEHINDIVVNLSVNDFNINNNNLGSSINIANNEVMPFQNRKFPLFYIIYSPSLQHFMLKCLTEELFFSLVIPAYKQSTLDTNNKSYFKLGKVVIAVLVKPSISSIQVKIRKCEGVPETKLYSFTSEQCPISIGRLNSTIVIKCESVSKSHATIDYDKLNDRYFIVDHNSTNGTQMLVPEGKSIKLEGEMKFTLGNKYFKVKEK
jgi:hypothetical protein